jgi:hypothetical protein
MSANSYTKTRFSANDAALVLIDHQAGILQLGSVRRIIGRQFSEAQLQDRELDRCQVVDRQLVETPELNRVLQQH